MFKAKKLSGSFLQKMEEHTQGKLNELQQIEIAKNKYLLQNKLEIIKAKASGYTYPMITEVATLDFLNSGVAKSFTIEDKDGNKIKYETKIRVRDIQNLCEPTV
ncbi:MAG: hypothetical protein Q9M32_03720 [Sulfurimonas sp.]|nr:hypothetical protein [Sulfurimonas sp.]MDQ7059915.1 hypothetical protein [Sulfurimonas sp.]